MDILSVQQCLSQGIMDEIDVPSHSDPDLTHSVIVQTPDDVEDAVCDCEGFTFRGVCSHQAEAIALVCGWREIIGPEEQDKEMRDLKICPRCGKGTEWTMEIAEDA